MSKQIKITLVKSPIGYNKKQKATVWSLGLRKMHSSVVLTETPQVRGMVNAVSHLVSVEDVEGEA